MDDLDCILCSTEVKKPRLCCQCSKLFCYECLFALYSQHELVTDTGNSAITSSVITAAVGLPAPTAATSTAAAATIVAAATIAAAVLDLHDSVVTRTAITGPAQARITAAIDSLSAITSSTTMGPTDATIVPGVVALHALRASAATGVSRPSAITDPNRATITTFIAALRAYATTGAIRYSPIKDPNEASITTFIKALSSYAYEPFSSSPITCPTEASITTFIANLRACATTGAITGPNEASVTAAVAALCSSVAAGVPISHITCIRGVHTASGFSTTSSRASAASSAASIYSRLRPCPNCNREQKLENYVKADFIEEIAKKLKEKDEQLVAKEKRIADRCAIHNEQKLFFCHTCEETKCHKCQKTCCANVNGKVYIEDVKDEVDNLWCAATVKFSQLQVNDCTHSVSLETCQ